MSVVKVKKFKWRPSPILSKSLRLLLLAVFFLLFIELGWLYITNFPRKTAVAEIGTIEKGCWVDAVYLRQETLLTAPTSGYLKIRVNSGTLIPKGEVIGWISETEVDELPEEALKLSKKLALIQSETDGLRQDFKRLNNEINYRVKKSIKDLKNSQDFIWLEQEKERVLRTIQYNQSEVEHLKTKLSCLLTGVTVITSNQPGIFSSEYDGYEGRLLPDKFRILKEEIFKKGYHLHSPGKRLSEGAIIGKMIQPFTGMLVVRINPRRIGIPHLGDEWRLKTSTGWRKVKIVDIISLTKDKMMIGFIDRNSQTDFQPQRRQKLFMIYHHLSGITIPVQAIFEKKGHSVVKVVKGDNFLEKEIRVLDTDGNQAIVLGIDFGTAILSR